MADQPCTRCGYGFSGRAFIAYVNFYDDRDLIHCRVRLCVNCVADHFLPMVDESDRKNERGVWIPAQGEREWPTAAPSVNTAIAQRADSLLLQPNQTTSTSTEGAANPPTHSAANAGSSPPSEPVESSTQSGPQGSDSKIPQPSRATSTSTSRSASIYHSNSRPRARTKSTGS